MEMIDKRNYVIFQNKGVVPVVMFQTERCKGLMANFLPGQSIPPHRHPGKHVLIHVESGAITLETETMKHTAVEREVVWVDGKELLSLTNDTDQATSVYLILQE